MNKKVDTVLTPSQIKQSSVRVESRRLQHSFTPTVPQQYVFAVSYLPRCLLTRTERNKNNPISFQSGALPHYPLQSPDPDHPVYPRIQFSPPMTSNKSDKLAQEGD